MPEIRINGQWQTGTCLVCLQKRQAQQFVDQACQANQQSIGLQASKTLGNFVAEIEHQKRGLAAARAFLEEVRPGHPQAIIFYSPPTDRWTGYGTGKTHLASAIAHELTQQGWHVAGWVVADLLSQIRESYDSNADDSEFAILRRAVRADLLILDELGLEHIGSRPGSDAWYREKLYMLVNGRYLHGPLVITTNLDPQTGLTRIGGAAFSRLWEMAGQGKWFVDMRGPDWRFK